MKLASFSIHDRATWGIVDSPFVIDVGDVLAHTYPDLKTWIARGNADVLKSASASATRYGLDEVSWLPVTPNPDKIFCVGLNYELHRKETGRAVVEHPTIFTRFANTQTGHMTNIVRPHVSTHLDFEGELAVIIGKPACHRASERVRRNSSSAARCAEASMKPRSLTCTGLTSSSPDGGR